MNTREDYERELSAYLDGELDENAAAAIERALEEQPALRERLLALRGADDALSRLPAPAPSEALLARVKAEMAREDAPQVEPRTQRRAAPRRTFRRAFVGAAFAAAAGLAVVALWPEASEDNPESFAAHTKPPGAVVDIEEEFGPLLEPVPDDPPPVLAAENGVSEGDLAVIEVLEFLEDLGDLAEAGRG